MWPTWLSWCDLGRFDEGVGYSVADIEQDERDVMTRELAGHDVDTADLFVATVRGLGAEVCRAADPMPAERARALLERLLEALARPEDEAA